MDIRRYNRLHTLDRLEAVVSDVDGMLRCEVHDLSADGVFLVTPDRLPMEHEVDVEITTTRADGRSQLKMRGVVTRHDMDGVGVRFQERDPDIFNKLGIPEHEIEEHELV